MNRCTINLGRDWIVPETQRRRIYRAMQLYLSVSFVLLGITAFGSFLNIQNAKLFRDQARAIQTRVIPDSGGSKGLIEYANTLQRKIESCSAQAVALQKALPDEIHTVLPLLTFIVNQPKRNGWLSKMSLTKEKGLRQVLEFSIALPSNGRMDSGRSVLQNWRNNPDLAASFSSITPVTTRLGNPENDDLIVVNYRALFKEQP